MKQVGVINPVGIFVRGKFSQARVPSKAISLKSGVHESTISRFLRGVKDIDNDQLINIVFAAGQVEAEARIAEEDARRRSLRLDRERKEAA